MTACPVSSGVDGDCVILSAWARTSIVRVYSHTLRLLGGASIKARTLDGMAPG